MPADAIEKLHEHFLDAAGGPLLRPEPLQEAWQWASRIALGVTSPLEPAKGGKWKAFDYLVSDAARRSDPISLPSPVWDIAVQLADDARRSLMSTVAKVAGRIDVAVSLLQPLARSNDIEGMINLGALLAGERDYEGAREWFVGASEQGDSTAAHNMGCISLELDDLDSALEWFTLAIERGELQSYAPLGVVHQKLGCEPEAVDLWRVGTEKGDAASALQYSDWLRSKWMSEESVAALRVAADGEIPFAALSYAGVMLAQKKGDKASAYVSKSYQVASRQARLGDSIGALMAGVISYSTGNIEMGEIWWRRAQDAGVHLDWVVVEASEWDGQGLQYLAVNTRTLEVLGEQELRVLMRCLWAGDCLDCGYSLKGGVPALHVDDQYNRADAKIFHFGVCRYPTWNDSAHVSIVKDSSFTWISCSGAVPVQGGEGVMPALIVNPALEYATLMLDGDSWTATGLCGPRTSMAEAFEVRPLWQGLPAASSRSRVYMGPGEISIPGITGVWSAPAADLLIDGVKRLGGILLVVTSALGPDDVASMETINRVLQSWDTMISWVPLGGVAE
ncbi:tetratricopeptide repeat protein [Streptomyces olivaceus]|uniref:tetratricopeptide repeat protein n=1 Tax=Streptomyces olivaceus TaxID=47716 RepID=UPI00405631DD